MVHLRECWLEALVPHYGGLSTGLFTAQKLNSLGIRDERERERDRDTEREVLMRKRPWQRLQCLL